VTNSWFITTRNLIQDFYLLVNSLFTWESSPHRKKKNQKTGSQDERNMELQVPDFTNTRLFPSFARCPILGAAPPKEEHMIQDEETWFLIAQIKNDMTITKPTLVLTDRDGVEFALVFDGLGRHELDFKKHGLKKGVTIVVPRARRTPPREEKGQGFVSIEKGREDQLSVIPGPLFRVMKVVEEMRRRREVEDLENNEDACAGCGQLRAGEVLKLCTGCSEVRYCNKVSSPCSCLLECGLKGCRSRIVRQKLGTKAATKRIVRSSELCIRCVCLEMAMLFSEEPRDAGSAGMKYGWG
jgi:hypothetical protein